MMALPSSRPVQYCQNCIRGVDEGLLRFACYVAICHTVYGQSFESLTTEHILGLVSQIRPDMVKELKTMVAANCRLISKSGKQST